MKNRILKRPMFKMGGSTDGIMSGLDTPSLDASRQGYQKGDVVEYRTGDETIGQLSSSDVLGRDVEQLFPRLQGIRDRLISRDRGRGMPGSVSNFLTGFGLNLLSQPGGSNIFQTAAKAAQTPYQQFVSSRQKEQDLNEARDEALFGDTIDAARRIRQAQVEAEGESGDKKVVQIEQETVKALQKTQKELEDKLKKANEMAKGSDDLMEGGAMKAEAEADAAAIKKEIENTEELKELITGSGGDPISEAILKGIPNNVFTFQDYVIYKKTGKIPEQKAEGGRIGYQAGSMVEAPTRSEVQNLDFTTLRSRLPREIGDDVVKLISDSGEALTDFANIRTQQDVDDFNQTYKVNLVLPAEV
jgi:hypothetical protein